MTIHRLSYFIPAEASHQIRSGPTEGMRILRCCAPPYSHKDTFFS